MCGWTCGTGGGIDDDEKPIPVCCGGMPNGFGDAGIMLWRNGFGCMPVICGCCCMVPPKAPVI